MLDGPPEKAYLDGLLRSLGKGEPYSGYVDHCDHYKQDCVPTPQGVRNLLLFFIIIIQTDTELSVVSSRPSNHSLPILSTYYVPSTELVTEYVLSYCIVMKPIVVI